MLDHVINDKEIAYFGAGCFWGTEATFRKLDGVINTSVGYMGGHTENPTYEDVCSDKSGHAEVVRVEYEPSKITYCELLNVFWKSHNPTEVNRQGPDIGSQYRSAIFYTTESQNDEAEKSLAKLSKSGKFKNKIVTEITEAEKFTIAEGYHQQYLEKRGLATCHPNFQE